MLSETVYRSDEVPAADRFDCWRELMSRTHAPMDLSSDHTADFKAHLRCLELGPVSVWPATYMPLTFRRTPKLIRQSDPESFHLSLMLRGHGGVVWGRQEAEVRTLDLHNNDSSRAYVCTSDSPLKTVGVEIPKAVLPLPRGKVERVIGRPMSGREGIGALLAQFLTRMAADAGSYQPGDGPRLGTVLTDLVAALFAQAIDARTGLLPPETHRRTLVLRIKAFIQRNLHDPQLTPRAVADAHHISVSYLHRIFQGEGHTVAGWIRTQRLEGTRRELADSGLAVMPVYAIACRWGFTRPADFSRAFRAAYGLTPTEHRRQALMPPNARTANKPWTEL